MIVTLIIPIPSRPSAAKSIYAKKNYYKKCSQLMPIVGSYLEEGLFPPSSSLPIFSKFSEYMFRYMHVYVYICIYITHAHTFTLENIHFKKRIAYFKYFISNHFSISKFKKFHLPFMYFMKSDFNCVV